MTTIPRATQEELAQAECAFVRQEIEAIHTSFPAIVVEHLELIDMPDGTRERGVLVGRAKVQPKMRTLWHNGKPIAMPENLNVPAPPLMRGPFMHFGAYKNGQTVMVTVSQVALDRLIEGGEEKVEVGTGTKFEKLTKHPVFPRFCDPKDAWISGDAVRMNLDPKFPKEYLNDYGWMLLDENYRPLSKLILRRNGQIRIECKHFYVRATEGIDMQKLKGPNVRHADEDDIVSTVRAADETSFKPGDITGPEITEPNSDPLSGGSD